MRGPALAEGPSSEALGQPATTDGASSASSVTLLSERKSSELWRGRAIARHPRCYGREDMSFNPIHHLPLF